MRGQIPNWTDQTTLICVNQVITVAAATLCRNRFGVKHTQLVSLHTARIQRDFEPAAFSYPHQIGEADGG
jgi:hypothetical protein